MAMYCCMHEVTSLFLLFCWFRINCVNIHSSLDVMMVVVDENQVVLCGGQNTEGPYKRNGPSVYQINSVEMMRLLSFSLQP